MLVFGLWEKAGMKPGCNIKKRDTERENKDSFFFLSIKSSPKEKNFKLREINKCHNRVTISSYYKSWNTTAHYTHPLHLLWKAVSTLSKQWDPFHWVSLSIAPGLVSKSLQTHLTLFKLELIAVKAILCRTLLVIIWAKTRPRALTGSLKRKFSIIFACIIWRQL